jgi:hypothetical protein
MPAKTLRKRSRRLEDMLPSVKRSRVSAGATAAAAAAPGKVRGKVRMRVVAGPPKAFACAGDSAPVQPEAERCKLRCPDPPVEMFKHVGYTRRGAAQRTLASGSVRSTSTGEGAAAAAEKEGAPPAMPAVFEEAARWIEAHCTIPADFERPARFGPLSGSTYSERIVQSFSLGLLTPGKEVFYPDALEELVDAGFAEQKSHLMLQPVEGNASRAELLLSA